MTIVNEDVGIGNDYDRKSVGRRYLDVRSVRVNSSADENKLLMWNYYSTTRANYMGEKYSVTETRSAPIRRVRLLFYIYKKKKKFNPFSGLFYFFLNLQ